ncbi:hypothetical protein J1N35_013501 [Gossypium stocksii]|uniref:DUF4283 domain-containing protein n=1 Tax=Gossypium stocksii TaxID=47602 RepID=A0A9D3VSK9_9ROSI|nr:hypothetical protein J1N35_013501 [Gossypium stocksii]
MALTVMVKLLRKKIGFNTLLNKASSLWKPGGRFELMDLENDFYLVRFQDNDDFDRILIGGPWILGPNNSGPRLHLSKCASGLNDGAGLVKSGFD